MDKQLEKWLQENVNLVIVVSVLVGLVIGIVAGSAQNSKNTGINTQSNASSASKSDDGKATAEKPATAEPAKPKVWKDGTYEVGRDIPAGTYIANGENCYWSINSDPNGNDTISSNFGSGQQIVTLTAGTYFKIDTCPFTAR